MYFYSRERQTSLIKKHFRDPLNREKGDDSGSDGCGGSARDVRCSCWLHENLDLFKS